MARQGNLVQILNGHGKVDRIYSRKQIEQAFLETFEMIGGIPRLAMWANQEENYESFLKLLMQLKPKEVGGSLAQVFEYRSNIPGSKLNRPAAGEDVVIIDQE